jgi:thioredoxin 1
MSDNVISVNESNFQKIVLDSLKPVLVDFGGPWCGPCRAVAPIIEELAKEYAGQVEFAKVNTEESPLLTSQYSVMSMPTIIFFKNGKPVQQTVGLKSKNELRKILDV